MKNTQTDRIPYISTARVIGILLVVIGHSYPFGVPIPTFLDQIRNFIYSFHMPLFIFISGYLAARSKKTGASYIANRAKRLMIPYFVLSVAAFFPKAMVQQYTNNTVEISWGFFLKSELIPRDNIWGHFWFLPVIFFFSVFSAFLGGRLKKYKWVQFLALVGSYALLWLPKTTGWFALEDMRVNLFWYVLGFALSETDGLEKITGKWYLLLGLPVSAALFLLNIEFKVLDTLLVLMSIFCIGTMWNVNRKCMWQTIEQYSFVIFLLSWPAQAVVEVVLNQILHLSIGISMVGMFIAGIMIPLLCVSIVNLLEKYRSVRWLKWTLGM